jgi:hypothetical protein
MVKFFPLGTSRLHEALEASPGSAAFPRLGYFHSSSQMKDALHVILDDRGLTLDQARYFFRKDQTPSNPFDTRVWTDELHVALAHARECLEASTHVAIEISSPRSYRLEGLHVQGNPNFHRNVPYAEVWREGYYAKYDPALDVEVYDDLDEITGNVREIASLLSAKGKRLVVLGHLIDPDNPHPTRVANNVSVVNAVRAVADRAAVYHDTSHLVREYGFRVLPDGTVDIHHLPSTAYPQLVDELIRTHGASIDSARDAD